MLNNAFHVHTFRCRHAENILDEEYIKRAVALGFSQITFTDHCPFPENPFGNRMDIEQLPEYIKTLTTLKEKYKNQIKVSIGLEAEYLPSYNEYYKKLLNDNDIELLILGQHFYEVNQNGKLSYSFENLTDEKRKTLWIKMAESTIEGINSGFFKVVAHPDRIFRMYDCLDDEMKNSSKRIISAAAEHNILLEKNISSMHTKKYYKPEFWALASNIMNDKNIIFGFDAHSLSELKPIDIAIQARA